jgi:hypothetical protein
MNCQREMAENTFFLLKNADDTHFVAGLRMRAPSARGSKSSLPSSRYDAEVVLLM